MSAHPPTPTRQLAAGHRPSECAWCGRPLQAGAETCEFCGARAGSSPSRTISPMEPREPCPRCGAPMPGSAHFCPACGRSRPLAPGARQAVAAVVAGLLSILVGALPFYGWRGGFPLGGVGALCAFWACWKAEQRPSRGVTAAAMTGLGLSLLGILISYLWYSGRIGVAI